jgi:hypothetical protein
MPFIASPSYDSTQETSKRNACHNIQTGLDKAIAYAWKQDVLTKKRSDADFKVTRLTKKLNKCMADTEKKKTKARSDASKKEAKACDKVQIKLDKAIKYAWKQDAFTKKRSEADWKVAELKTKLTGCQASSVYSGTDDFNAEDESSSGLKVLGLGLAAGVAYYLYKQSTSGA